MEEQAPSLFEILNIPYIRAVNEADTLISKLYKTKHIDACLSEDMDLLVFGCKKLIKFNHIIICTMFRLKCDTCPVNF